MQDGYDDDIAKLLQPLPMQTHSHNHLRRAKAIFVFFSCLLYSRFQVRCISLIEGLMIVGPVLRRRPSDVTGRISTGDYGLWEDER